MRQKTLNAFQFVELLTINRNAAFYEHARSKSQILP